MIRFVRTRSGFQVYSPTGDNYFINDDHPLFKQLKSLVLDHEKTFEEFDELYKTYEPTNILQEFIFKDSLKIEQLIDGSFTVSYKGLELPPNLTRRLIKIFSATLSDVTESVDDVMSPIVNFVEKLLLNPSRNAVNELYNFLEACSLPITNDGDFLAYKKVRRDYKDIHSGTFDNSVCKVLKMERWQVDEDRNRTCSSGFHCCAFDYLSSFGSTQKDSHRVVIVKVNPKDVVSVPVDYKNQKMRVCEYVVMDDLPTAVESKLNPWYIPPSLEGRVGELMNGLVATLVKVGESKSFEILSRLESNGFNFNDSIILPRAIEIVVFKEVIDFVTNNMGLELLPSDNYLDEYFDGAEYISIQGLVNFIAEWIS